MKLKKLEKYIPAHVSKYVYIGLIVAFLLLALRTKWQQDGGLKIGDRFIMSNYNIDLELTKEERLGYGAEVQKYDDLINGVYVGTGEDIEIGADPKQIRFLYKSFNLAMLGRHNEAIKTLKDAEIYYKDSLSLKEAFARTYTQAEAYKMAANTYEEIITNNPDKYMDYIKPEIAAYIMLENDDKAGELYIEYITAGGKEDLAIVNGIRALRDMEPME